MKTICRKLRVACSLSLQHCSTKANYWSRKQTYSDNLCRSCHDFWHL